jgi:peroxiredoxin
VISPTGVVEHAFRNVKATGHVAKLIRDLGLAQ